ncbi:hypothetical protein LX32DRAFT_640532 [Colletotrichum zoysiae]|uniref:Uncharacterized protein n=1 Tax=Colletotrichum zoysiae TaxID=1216348 RepID=A0AAD9HF99_9PEZI|nr:hypothetical protein LX32DRAFT_640532 [Colletotrichum zoysiae]
MQAQFIIAALGAATAGFASPVPGLFDHIACGNLLNNIIDNLSTAITDIALANSGFPPAGAATLLQGVKDTVDNNWERRNKATAGIKQAELFTATNTVNQVLGMLNGTDPTTVQANNDVKTISVQFEQIKTTCEIDDSKA